MEIVGINYDSFSEMVKTLYKYLCSADLMSSETKRNLIVVFFESEKILKRSLTVYSKRGKGIIRNKTLYLLELLEETERMVYEFEGEHSEVFMMYSILRKGNGEYGSEYLRERSKEGR